MEAQRRHVGNGVHRVRLHLQLARVAGDGQRAVRGGGEVEQSHVARHSVHAYAAITAQAARIKVAVVSQFLGRRGEWGELRACACWLAMAIVLTLYIEQ